MNLSVLSIATDDFVKFREASFPNKSEYCKVHGYNWLGETKTRDSGRPASWSKILALAELCRTKECDWALWTDADSAVPIANMRRISPSHGANLFSKTIFPTRVARAGGFSSSDSA